MTFMFEWPVFLPREHKTHIFELTCNVLFIIQTCWWRRFWPFSEDFRRFFKTCPKVTQTLPNISENFRRLPKTFKEDPKIFPSYTNKFKYNLRDKLDISEITDIFTSEDMENTPVESQMWFRMNFTSGVFFSIITYMKKLLDSDWLRAVQFKCNTSAKRVTPVQITQSNPRLWLAERKQEISSANDITQNDGDNLVRKLWKKFSWMRENGFKKDLNLPAFPPREFFHVNIIKK